MWLKAMSNSLVIPFFKMHQDEGSIIEIWYISSMRFPVEFRGCASVMMTLLISLIMQSLLVQDFWVFIGFARPTTT